MLKLSSLQLKPSSLQPMLRYYRAPSNMTLMSTMRAERARIVHGPAFCVTSAIIVPRLAEQHQIRVGNKLSGISGYALDR